MDTKIEIITVNPEDVVSRIECWWDDYEESFPCNERFNKDRMVKFILHSNNLCNTRVNMAMCKDEIVGVKMSKIFFRNDFDFALEIWTKPKYRGRKIGRKLYAHSQKLNAAQGLHFYAEVNPNRPLTFFHKIGLIELPIKYYQPPVSKYHSWIPLRLMIDKDLSRPIINRSNVEQDIGLIYQHVYGVSNAYVKRQCKFMFSKYSLKQSLAP